MNELSEAIGGAVIIIGFIIIVFIIAKFNYLIKKAMIEKGIKPTRKSRDTQLLEIGCVVLGLGIGLMISTLYISMDLSEDATDTLSWGTILIFSALGLLAAHYTRKKLGAQ